MTIEEAIQELREATESKVYDLEYLLDEAEAHRERLKMQLAEANSKHVKAVDQATELAARAAKLEKQLAEARQAYRTKFHALVQLCGILDGDGPLSGEDRQCALQIAADA